MLIVYKESFTLLWRWGQRGLCKRRVAQDGEERKKKSPGGKHNLINRDCCHSFHRTYLSSAACGTVGSWFDALVYGRDRTRYSSGKWMERIRHIFGREG